MKIVAIAFFSACVAIRGAAMDASELVKQNLHQRGLRAGYNSDRNVYITIADSEVYRSRNEAERNKAAECAFMKALAKMAKAVAKMRKPRGNYDSEKGTNAELATRRLPASISSHSTWTIDVTATVLMQAASYESQSGSGVAYALSRSDKTAKTAAAALRGDAIEVSQFNGERTKIDEWMAQNFLSVLGPRIVYDSPTHFWVIGAASQDADDNNCGIGSLMTRAAYAAECALGGRVEVTESVESAANDSDGNFCVGETKQTNETCREDVSNWHEYCCLYIEGGFKSEMLIKLSPYLRINPASMEIKWFLQTGVNKSANRRIRVAIAAIDSNDLHKFASPDAKPGIGRSCAKKR